MSLDFMTVTLALGVLLFAAYASIILTPMIQPLTGFLPFGPAAKRFFIVLGLASLIGIVFLGLPWTAIAVGVGLVNVGMWFLPGGRFR